MKLFWKENIFGGMFVVCHIGHLKIIWQNKDPFALHDICMYKLFSKESIRKNIIELHGMYVAITHEGVIQRLTQAGAKVKKTFWCNGNLRSLNINLVEKTKCTYCTKKYCFFRDGSNSINNIRKEWLVFIKI